MAVMAEDLSTLRTTKPVRRRRGWGRALAIAVGVHLVLGVVAWRVGARFGMWTARNSAIQASAQAKASPQIPVIMQAVEAINAAPGHSPLAAFAEGDGIAEWQDAPHERVGVDWSGENAPLIGYRTSDENLFKGLRVKK